MSQPTQSAAFPIARTFFAWFFALLIFFPLLWLGLTAFKTEGDAILRCRSAFKGRMRHAGDH